eukprot:SAG31_NODE_2888_length_4948_cov_2.055475_5_plen_43_part_00
MVVDVQTVWTASNALAPTAGRVIAATLILMNVQAVHVSMDRA